MGPATTLGQHLAAGFVTTAHDTLTILSVTGDVVTIDLTAVQTSGTQQTYTGTYAATGTAITKFVIQQKG